MLRWSVLRSPVVPERSSKSRFFIEPFDCLERLCASLLTGSLSQLLLSFIQSLFHAIKVVRIVVEFVFLGRARQRQQQQHQQEYALRSTEDSRVGPARSC